MNTPILRLSADDVWTVLDEVDPMRVLVEAASADPVDRIARPSALGCSPDGESVLFPDPVTGDRCLLPAGPLRAMRLGALAALIAVELLEHGVVTCGLLGCGRAAQDQLLVVTRCLRHISQLAIFTPDRGARPPLDPWVLDRLELSGIALEPAYSPAEVAFGADLVIATDEQVGGLRFEDLSHSSVLVNTSDQPAPADVAWCADIVFVDDVRSLTGHPHLALSGPAGKRPTPPRHQTGTVADRRRCVDGDQADVLRGRCDRLLPPDGIALVEVLGTGQPTVFEAALATEIWHATQVAGLGIRIFP